LKKFFVFFIFIGVVWAKGTSLESYALENIKDKDWIILTSGELIIGDFKHLYDEYIEFKSTRFKTQNIKFKYIKRLKTNKIVTINIDNISTFTGYLDIKGSDIKLKFGKKTAFFDKSQLVSAAKGREDWKSSWENEITINLGFKSGNSEQADFGTILKLRNKLSKSKLSIDYIGNFSTTHGVTIINNQRLNADYQIYQTKNFFWKPFFGEFYKDEFSNIKSSYNIGLGLGYKVVNQENLDIEISGGPAYKKTKFYSYEVGEKSQDSVGMLSVTTNLESEITDDLDFDISYKFEFLDKQNGGYTHHILSKLDHDIYEDFDLAISFIWDRIQNPTRRDDGTLPKKDNFQLLFGLGYEF
jgi:hypothetical protein